MARTNRIHGPIRRTGGGRKQQIQGLTNKEIQILKALDSAIQEKVDSYRNSRTERFNGSLRADLYLRLREGTGSIYYPLPKKLLHSIRLWRLHMESTAGCIQKNRGENIPSDITALVGRLSEDARANQHDGGS